MNVPLKKTAAALMIVSLVGCDATMQKKTLADAKEMSVGPASAPTRSITNFSDGLRCMDNLMLAFGIRDVSTLVEDLSDQTKKINIGAKDMLITAVSDMTRRSRAIRLIAFGNDSGNMVTFLNNAERKQIYSAVPLYGIRGSVSQLDEKVSKRNIEAGIGTDKFGVGAGASTQADVVALDLSMVSTQDLSVLPGVTSKNQVIVMGTGQAADADATIKKFGINFAFSVGKTEGKSQAVRNLMDLAAIELVGRLTKTPYWTCVGASSNDPAIKAEMSDWFFSMQASNELTKYFQEQLRFRGFYAGPVDGQMNDQLKEAVINFRKELGLSAEPKIDEPMFMTFLNSKLATQASAMAPIGPQQQVAKAPEPDPKAVKVASAKNGKGKTMVAKAQGGSATGGKTAVAGKKRGDGDDFDSAINLLMANRAGSDPRSQQVSLQTDENAFVYCFSQDSKGVQRLFPNRFARDPYVAMSRETTLASRGGTPLQLAGNGQEVACFATQRDVFAQLPDNLRAPDFEPIPGASLESLRGTFQQLSGERFGSASIKLASR